MGRCLPAARLSFIQDAVSCRIFYITTTTHRENFNSDIKLNVFNCSFRKSTLKGFESKLRDLYQAYFLIIGCIVLNRRLFSSDLGAQADETVM